MGPDFHRTTATLSRPCPAEIFRGELIGRFPLRAGRRDKVWGGPDRSLSSDRADRVLQEVYLNMAAHTLLLEILLSGVGW